MQIFPDDPCREYLPTLGSKWPHSRGNVGKYTIHGSYGIWIVRIPIYKAGGPRKPVINGLSNGAQNE